MSQNNSNTVGNPSTPSRTPARQAPGAAGKFARKRGRALRPAASSAVESLENRQLLAGSAFRDSTLDNRPPEGASRPPQNRPPSRA